MPIRRIQRYRLRALSALGAFAFFSFSAAFAANQNDLIRSGDKLQVTVYNHPDLSQNVVVDSSGNVSLPLIGSVPAENAESAVVAQRIAAKIARFDPKPAVEVQIVSSDPSIFISGGAVGVLPYIPGETLSQAIAQVESPPQQIATSFASTPSIAASRNLLNGRVDLHRVSLTRNNASIGVFDAAALAESGQSGPALKPGDIIGLMDKPIRVSVQGNVQEPGFAYLGSNEPLSNAIAQVGGVTQDSAAHVDLTRGGKTASYPLGDAILMQPGENGDIVTLPRAPHVGVVGAVDKPGDVTLHGDTTLLSAIYNAGGPTRVANLKTVAVVHNGVRTQYDVIAAVHGGAGNPQLTDGDTVFVPVGHKVDFSAFWQAVGAAGSLALGLR